MYGEVKEGALWKRQKELKIMIRIGKILKKIMSEIMSKIIVKDFIKKTIKAAMNYYCIICNRVIKVMLHTSLFCNVIK